MMGLHSRAIISWIIKKLKREWNEWSKERVNEKTPFRILPSWTAKPPRRIIPFLNKSCLVILFDPHSCKKRRKAKNKKSWRVFTHGGSSNVDSLDWQFFWYECAGKHLFEKIEKFRVIECWNHWLNWEPPKNLTLLVPRWAAGGIKFFDTSKRPFCIPKYTENFNYYARKYRLLLNINPSDWSFLPSLLIQTTLLPCVIQPDRMTRSHITEMRYIAV